MMHEVDMSLPFQVPDDRPLTYGEQMAIWRDIWQGPFHKCSEEAVRHITRRYGYIMNRLDFDRNWVGPTDTYEVPGFCVYPAERVRRSTIDAARRNLQRISPLQPGEGMFGQALDGTTITNDHG